MDKKLLQSLTTFSHTLRLLYVEDNAQTRVETEHMLENFFTDITIAVDGEDGLKKFKEGDFDLIISDINMPKMDGLQMLEKIRQVDDEVVFIIISAHNEAQKFEASIKLGTDGYLLKPIVFNNFLSLMRKTIQKLKLKYENDSYKKELEKKVYERTKALEKKLDIDDLTGCMSRYAFLNELKSYHDSDEIPTLFLLNIDSFGLYNELYGIEVGNEILISFSHSIQLYANVHGYGLYRISGDEFILYEKSACVDDERNDENIKNIFKYIKEHTLWIESIQDTIELSVTIGLSTHQENPLGKADMAMKCAKKQLIKYAVYTASIDTHKDLKKIIYWKKEIALALQEQRVIPYFQPIVNRNQEVIKYEALMRIKQFEADGTVKIISPFFFLDISVKTKQYDALSYRLIHTAIELMKDKNVSLSVNINQHDMNNRHLTTMLKEHIMKFNEHPMQKNHYTKQIILEILEDDNIKDYAAFTKQLVQFRHLGAQIAIDDFGSGFSNFSHIIGISPHYIKIDGSLIKDIHENQKSYEIVKAIIQFAKSLNIKTIAEFVSSKEIFDVAYSLGIDEFQGYYFAQPLSIEEIEDEVLVLA